MNLNAYAVILASTSPRRKQLLGSLNLSFQLNSPGFEEKLEEGENASDYVKRNGEGKARSIAKEISSGLHNASSDKKHVIIGADTVVVLDGMILQKPKSADEAVAMLHQLSGRTHQVFTGFSLSFQKEAGGEFATVSEVMKTDVSFKILTDDEIKDYVSTGEPMDKAGAYGIQGKAAYFVNKISGSYTNVMGLPLTEVYEQLISLP